MSLNDDDETPHEKKAFDEKVAMWEIICRDVNAMPKVRDSIFRLKPGENYSEQAASLFLELSFDKLRRARQAGELIPGTHYLWLGPRGIRYAGWQILEMRRTGWTPPRGGAPAAPKPAPETPASAVAKKTF